MKAVPVFMDTIQEASHQWLVPDPLKAKHSTFFNKDCRHQLRAQRKAHRLMLRKLNQQNIKHFQTKSKNLKTCIRLSKCHAAAKVASEVTNTNIWCLNDWYRGIRHHFTPVLSKGDGTFTILPSEKTSLMHKSWFASKPLTPDPRDHCDLESPIGNTRTLERIPWTEIMKVLTSCSNQSTPGQSGIGYAILKWVAKSAPDELAAIIRTSVCFGIHHPCWKTSAIIAIPKAKKPSYADPKAWCLI